MLTNIIIPHGIANLHDASEFMEFAKLNRKVYEYEKLLASSFFTNNTHKEQTHGKTKLLHRHPCR